MTDPRDLIWDSAFEIYYKTYYEEILFDRLTKRMQRIDAGARYLIAVTASGSAIAGLSFWQNDQFKIIWAIISVLTALIAIAHSTQSIPKQLKEYMKAGGVAVSLRHEIENFRNDMNLNPAFDVNTANDELKGYRQKYVDLIISCPKDIFCSDKMENSVQDNLENRIAGMIEG
jgi:hypothetical protein